VGTVHHSHEVAAAEALEIDVLNPKSWRLALSDVELL